MSEVGIGTKEARIKDAAHVMLFALREVRDFVADELATRKASYEPGATSDEAMDIEEAVQALAAVDGAIARAEGRS